MLALLALTFVQSAQATDTWTTPHAGLDLLHRTTAEPWDIWAARIDLSLPTVQLHASSDEIGVERKVNTKTFAVNTGATLAINSDWSDGTTPVGLAISNGAQWHDHIHDDTLGGTWGYVACTITKQCSLGVELPLDSAWWFSTPTLAPYRFYQATGANGIQMVNDGVKSSGCFDSVRNPRSAMCVEADGQHIWMMVIDGRSSSSDGMTCDEVRDLMVELGCWDGVMLDGGGSSTLVLDGSVLNDPSDGSLRTVSNHFGVTFHSAVDSACPVANGRWCDGTVLSACEGGQPQSTGDCGYYGLACQEDGDWAFCVDPRCPGGDGLGAECLDATQIATCNDGVYGTGDCAAFGLVCGTDTLGAGCMDARCAAGPHSGFCTDSGAYAACTDGAYAETDCVSAGLVCDPAAGCVSPDAGDDGGGEGEGEGEGAGGGAEEASGEVTRAPKEGCSTAPSASPTEGGAWGRLALGLSLVLIGLRGRRGVSDR
jgi:hypothetical protein